MKEHSHAEREKMKAKALRTYVSSGGLAEDFESQWPEILNQLLLARTVERMGHSQDRIRSRL